MVRRWLVEAGTAVLSLLLALIVWAVAEQENNPIFVVRGVPVNLQGMEKGMALRSPAVASVDVRIRAPENIWESLRTDDFAAFVDLTGLGAGRYGLPVHVPSPQPEVQILSVNPATIVVELEAIVQKRVPVRVEVMDSLSLPFGYEMHDPVVTPPEVLVSGPSRHVESVASAVAEVYLRAARSTVERRLPVSLRDKDGQTIGNVVQWTPRMVTVTVPIEQRPGYRDVRVRVRWEGQPAKGYNITEVAVEPSIVTIYGSPAAIEAVPGYVDTVPVNIEGADSDVVERVALIVPENVSVFGSPSVVVSVGITPIEIHGWLVRRMPVVQGLGDGLQAEISPLVVDVFLAGPLPRLETLGPGDVQVVLDLTGLEPDTHILEPTVIVPEGIRIETLVPQSVEVKITRIPTPTPTPTVTPTATVRAALMVTVTPIVSPTVTATVTITPTTPVTVTPTPTMSAGSQGE